MGRVQVWTFMGVQMAQVRGSQVGKPPQHPPPRCAAEREQGLLPAFGRWAWLWPQLCNTYLQTSY